MADSFVTYDDFFERAVGYPPYPFQRRVVGVGRLPELIEIPPGYGKTAAIVLAWLWLRCFAPDPAVRASTPRRLIYALPMRTLTAQIGSEIERWLGELGLSDDVDLHVVMGGTSHRAKPWREHPERVSILVGTIDLLTSKALVRAYGTPRNAFPMDAALVWNDAHVVVDEVQAAPATTITMRQIDAFRRGRTVGPAGLTCMSATVPRDLIDTVDNCFPADDLVIRLGDGDDKGDLQTRRDAARVIRKLDLAPRSVKGLATAAIAEHDPATMTLVIVNTVKLACEIYAAVVRAKPEAKVILLHSRFRPADRAPIVRSLLEGGPAQGRIVISTQVVEAGMDLDAKTLITEVAPWPSLVQRSGRCNRAGLCADASMYWALAKDAPYQSADLAASVETLTLLEGQLVTNEQLLGFDVDTSKSPTLTLRRRDFDALFDTMPDLSGNDLDVAPYIRDADELDVQLCWMEWEGLQPPDDLRPLGADERCRVPLSGVAELVARQVRVWRFDQLGGRWRTLSRQAPARPGEVLLVAANDGGYVLDRGFDVNSTAAVPRAASNDATDTQTVLGDTEVEDSLASDPNSIDQPAWIPLDQHLSETAAEATMIVAEVDVTHNEADDVVLAARIHDIGKAHPTWQDALCGLASDHDGESVGRGRPWAKSAVQHGRLRYRKGIDRFRHELASVVLLDGPLSGLLDGAHDADLVRYLVMAHHGKLRVQVRDTQHTTSDQLLGLIDGETIAIPSVLGGDAAEFSMNLKRFAHGGDPGTGLASWADTVAGLLDRYGPFRLAYLETLVRVADWRASALHQKEATR